MRTKILLASAAALALGVASSNAQVYSANVVGYVTLSTPPGAQYAAMENPLDLDGVDSITNVFATAPKGTTVQLWTGSGFKSVGTSTFTGAWNAGAGTNYIPPGVGFLIKTPSPYTNTFVGTVIPAEGATNSLALTGGVLYFVGSSLPVSGTISNAVDQGVNTLNLGNMPKGTTLQLWSGSGYTSVGKSTFTGVWSANPTIGVGQAFFLKAGSTTNWQQTLQ